MEASGLLHIHSSLSHDAFLTPEQIRKILGERGYSFGIICDHQKDLNENSYRELRRRCRELNTRERVLIPGLEFEFGAVHILGIAISEYLAPRSLKECVAGIKRASGLAIWAHPDPRTADLPGDILKELDGIEVWSARYGAKYAPSTALCRMVRRVRKENHGIFAYAGLDAHREDQIQDLYVQMELPVIEESSIITDLKNGNYLIQFGKMAIPSSGHLNFLQKAIFPFFLHGYKLTDKLIDWTHRKS